MPIPAETKILDIEYVSIGRAAEMLGVGRRLVKKMADNGEIGRMSVPGSPMKLVKADVLHVARKCSVPSRVGV